jgi:hypothetical protein
MGYIEESDLLTDRGMFGQNTSAWVLDRHQPTTEIRHFCR